MNNRKRKRLKRLLVILIIVFVLLAITGLLLMKQQRDAEHQAKKAKAIAALESVPTVTPTPAATPTPTPTPVPTVTPTPPVTRIAAFNPEDYMGTWYSPDGKVTIVINELTLDKISFSYTQTSDDGTAVCQADVQKAVAGNASRFSFKDSLGNKAKGYFTFDSGKLYIKIFTKKQADGAAVSPSAECILVRG
ncbi:MAG: hypothetical protein SO401_02560 [Blautia sp.]|nr:hypothetical protein [Blautia sp.]